jgi:hypothetical protein
VLSGFQAEVSESMLQVKKSRFSPVVVVFAPAGCEDGSKVVMVPLQQVLPMAALLSPQSGAEQIAAVKLGERHSVGTLGDRLPGQF